MIGGGPEGRSPFGVSGNADRTKATSMLDKAIKLFSGGRNQAESAVPATGDQFDETEIKIVDEPAAFGTNVESPVQAEVPGRLIQSNEESVTPVAEPVDATAETADVEAQITIPEPADQAVTVQDKTDDEKRAEDEGRKPEMTQNRAGLLDELKRLREQQKAEAERKAQEAEEKRLAEEKAAEDKKAAEIQAAEDKRAADKNTDILLRRRFSNHFGANFNDIIGNKANSKEYKKVKDDPDFKDGLPLLTEEEAIRALGLDDLILKARYEKSQGGRSVQDDEWRRVRGTGDDLKFTLPELTDQEKEEVVGPAWQQIVENTSEGNEATTMEHIEEMIYPEQEEAHVQVVESAQDLKETEEGVEPELVPGQSGLQEKLRQIVESMSGSTESDDEFDEEVGEEESDVEKFLRLLGEEELPTVVRAEERVVEAEEGLVEQIGEKSEQLQELVEEIDELTEELADHRDGTAFELVLEEELSADGVADKEGGLLSWVQNKIKNRAEKRAENKARRIARAKIGGSDFSQKLFAAAYDKMSEGDQAASRRLAERKQKIAKDAMYAGGGLVTALVGPLVTFVGGGLASAYGLSKGSWDLLRGTATVLNKGLDKAGIAIADTALEVGGATRATGGKIASKIDSAIGSIPEVQQSRQERGVGMPPELQTLVDQMAQMMQQNQALIEQNRLMMEQLQRQQSGSQTEQQ